MALIEIDNLSKVYNGSPEVVRAVNGISLTIDHGEFVAVVGPSGSGKSTLLSILGGLNHPTQGKLVVDDIDVYSLSTEQLADFRREYIGFVFQSFQLISYLSFFENVMIPLRMAPLPKAEKGRLAIDIIEKV